MHDKNFAVLTAAVGRYLDLMHDVDISTFDQVFRRTAQLHGLVGDHMRVLSAQDYKAKLASGPSPKSKGAPREEQILLIDFASPTQALVKVRVRIDTIVYVDYLSYHFVNCDWLISAKTFHIESQSIAA